ncbi:MAG TPA: bifunctional glutamate N-acetyltransferase/amino-acid acetyltransferase ArgJ [Spongiibacteraceae bacterium]|nr:bifunctional glutamate N-acetyltransferase/amino-acid acetyltransferase ArgJ [Spongiibacteraceae bacterium]
MAVGSGTLPILHPVAGFGLGIASAGIKKPGRLDLVIMQLAANSNVAAVFTRNAFCAAPVQLAKQHLGASSTRYLLINTGNANAGTGESGLQNARKTCEQLAELAQTSVQAILPFSTGVIGEPLPVEKICAALPSALADLSEDNWLKAAQGIMTTDTRPKAASVQIDLDGKRVTITGISKGAGMIKPNMATMLGYVATDAAVNAATLQLIIERAVNRSFNRITIDGDTSTNDSCILAATGCAQNNLIDSEQHPLFKTLYSAVEQVFIELAHAIIRDGEGATKFVAVDVQGGASEAECLQVAYAVAESPLVKTALFASDPNWGRILAAIGRAGVSDLDVDLISVKINGVLIAERGGRSPHYTEQQGAAAMAPEEITIAIQLGRGAAQTTVWTTDLSHDYVTINAEYRT